MSTTQQFISELYSLGVKVHADGGKLRLRAPKGALTPALRDELAGRKEEILAFLQQVDAITNTAQTAIRPTARDGELPLSFAQQRLWFLQQLEGPSATYNMDHCVTLEGELDIDQLEKALQKVVQRHEVLRTCFPDVNGKPTQKIAPELYVPIEVVELQPVSDAQPSETIIQEATKFVQQPFDLTTGPLLRTGLIKWASEHVASEQVSKRQVASNMDNLQHTTCNMQHATFIFAMHHIISDGWSMDIFVQELIGYYEAMRAGRPDPLPPLPIQYADYAQWQRQRLTGDTIQRQIDFWRDHLAGAPALLELPTDHPRPAVQTFAGAMEEFVLDSALTAELNAFCRERGISAYMVLQSVFAILLMRYSGQEDIVMGTPIANRTQREVEPLIGFFVNTLALRSDLADNPTFMDVVNRTQQTMLDAQAHQDIPFERLVEELKPARNMSHNPIFQVMFALQNVPEQEVALADLQITPFEIDKHVSKFDLTLSLYETSGQVASGHVASEQSTTCNLQTANLIEGTFEYSTDLFDQVTIQRMVEHFRVLLADALRNPSQRIWQLALLTEGEQQQILVDWNDTYRDYDLSRPLHSWFEAQAQRAPDQIALVFERETLTYGELNARANQLAHHLRHIIDSSTSVELVETERTLRQAQGTERLPAKPLIGVCMERSIEMVVSLYAILKAGGAYVPMDPDYPAERLQFMMEDSQTPILLTQARFAHLALPDTHVIALDREWSTIARESTENPNMDVRPTDLAYMIYTSGSTGRPKGAMNGHQGIVNRLLWMQEAYELDSSDSVLQKTPFSFDVSVWEFFWPLMMGARLVIAEPGGHKDNGYLVKLIQEQQITTLHFVPPMLQLFVEEPGVEACQTLRRVICSGEALPYELQQRFFARLDAQRTELHNLYGPTEAAIDVTYWACQPDHSLGIVPIGRPVANTQIYVLDPYLQPVPVGAYGELHIGGVQVAHGYLNRPELNAEKFIKVASGRLQVASGHVTGEDMQHATCTLYKTGDSVRFLPDGNIEYIGRIDHQVKIRGFRIELGEIEALINEAEAVRECVVIVREDSPGQKMIVAYAVLAGAAEADLETLPGELRENLGTKLPDYMVPTAIVLLDALPLSPNGKIDRRALPAPALKGSEEHYVAPSTPVEEILAAIWSEVLNIDSDPIGIYDNFFELGGHSLLAIQVLARIRTAFQVEVPVRTLFESATIAKLSAIIELLHHENIMAKNIQDVQPEIPLSPITRQEYHPLSFAQQRLWFLDQLEGGSAAYNMPVVMQIQGPLDVARLQLVFNEIVRRHESLRTTFTTVNGEPVQRVAGWQGGKVTEFQRVDLNHLPSEQQAQMLNELIDQEINTPFDLSAGLLLRVTLFELSTIHCQLSTVNYQLLLNMHHIISDGWSLGVLMREVTALYEAFERGLPSPLPELSVQYIDYAHWQRDWLAGDVSERQLTYWREQLAGVPAQLELPIDRPRPPRRTFNGREERFVIDGQLTQRLEQLGSEAGTTLFMTVQAAFATLLHRYSGQDDIVIGTPVANRNREEVEGLIGFFVNTLALRTDFSENPTFAQLLQQVRQTTLDAYNHQDIPFEQLVEDLQPDRNLSQSPLFQVMLAWQTTPDVQSMSGDLKLTPVELETTAAKFDITLFISHQQSAISGQPSAASNQQPTNNKQLLGSVEYNSDLFDRTTIQRLIGHLQTLLAGIVADPEKRVDGLNLLRENERQQLLYQWNETAVNYPGGDQCVHTLIEAQVARTPEAVAVRFEGQNLTYLALDQRANQLAHSLQKIGVGPNQLVGICMERSFDMVVTMLAVHKAGGAYVPLDPAYPPERLRFMISDSQAPVILTQQHLQDLLFSELLDDWDTRVHIEDAVILCNPVTLQPCNPATLQPCNPATLQPCPDDLAYVIYTSGSTGNPKGVMITHRAIGNRLRWGEATFAISATDKILQKTPFSFDASVWEFFSPLQAGATLVMARPDGHKDSRYLIQTIQEEGITILQGVPSMYRMLVEDENFQHCTTLRRVFCAGEALPMTLAKQIVDTLGQHVQFVNTYGPTEAAIDTTYWPYDPTVPCQIAPIGKPIDNARVYILDEELEPVPIGVAGELYIEGAGLAQGYLNRLELTQNKFICNPFSNNPSHLLYQTGDRVRYLADGNIEFLGRLDHQVKIRGFRIELGEIEAAMDRQDGVHECVVVAREEAGQQQLVAYIGSPEFFTDSLAWVDGLRTALRATLPDYMIPTAFVVLERLPLLPNGKVNRHALPVPERTDLGIAYVAPRDTVEIELARIWTDLLEIQPIGVRDDFFALGGHSLLAVRLVAGIEETFDRMIPLATLFEHPTIEGLATLLRANPERLSWSSLTPIQPHGNKPPLFCVPGAGGTIIYLIHLARYLGQEQPFYGLQSVGLDGVATPHKTVESMASAYVTTILEARPEGPYLLGGHSFGGKVAFEMAQQLCQAGQDVKFLALDTPAPGYEPDDESERDEAEWLALIASDIAHFLGREIDVTIDRLRQQNGDEQLRHLHQRLVEVDWLPAHGSLQQLRGLVEVYKANLQATYHPQQIMPVPIVLLRTENESADEDDPTWGWGAFADGEVDVRTVPGDHYTMMADPHVEVLAGELKEVMG